MVSIRRRAWGVEEIQRIQRLNSIVFLVGFMFQLVAIRVLAVKAIPECKGKRALLSVVCQAFIKLFADMLNRANLGIRKIARGLHGKTPVSDESGILQIDLSLFMLGRMPIPYNKQTTGLVVLIKFFAFAKL